MKRILSITVMAMIAVMLCLAVSCTSKKETDKKVPLSPEMERHVEAMKKDAEHAKTVTVARVNGAPIMLSDLVQYMNAITPKYVRPGQRPTPEIGEKVKHDALNILIFRELAIQEAAKEGLNPKPEDVENALKQVKAKFGTEAAYKNYLGVNGLTEPDLKKAIERELRYEMIATKEIHQKLGSVTVSEKKLKDIYSSDKARFSLPERFTAVDIHFTSGKDDAPTRKESQTILAALKSGADMTKLTGHFVIRQITVTQAQAPNIFAALSLMKAGAVSGIIAERDGLHIEKMVKKEAAGEMTFNEAKPFIQQELMLQAAEKRREDWDREMRKNARIEVLAVKEMENNIRPAY